MTENKKTETDIKEKLVVKKAGQHRRTNKINKDSLLFLSSEFSYLSVISIISMLYLLAKYLIDSG